MMDQARPHTSVPQRHAQRGQRQRIVQPIIQMPSDHTPRIRIQNHRQVDELLLQPDVRDVRYPELIDTAEDQRGRPIGIDLQPVRGVGRHHEPPLRHTQQIVFLHPPLQPLAIDIPAAGLQFPRDPPASIAGPFQRDFLHLVAQVHVRRRRLLRIQKTVVARPAESGRLAHPNDTQLSPRFHFFFDLPIEGAPLFSARSRRRSSTCCKALFKKSISMACWPTFLSNSTTRLSTARFLHTPRNTCSPCSCNSRRQRWKSLGCTSNARATSTTLCPLFSRPTADCLKSLVNFLRDFMFQFPLSMIFKG